MFIGAVTEQTDLHSVSRRTIRGLISDVACFSAGSGKNASDFSELRTEAGFTPQASCESLENEPESSTCFIFHKPNQ